MSTEHSRRGLPARHAGVLVLLGVTVLAAGCAQTVQAPESPAAALTPGTPAVPPPAPFDGLKKRLAVIKFENKVRTPLPDASWQIGEGLTEMLTTELFRSGRFIMVERSALTDIVKEQELGQTGLVQKETAAKVGELLGAQLLVAGAVTEFEANTGGGGATVGFGGFGVGLRTNVAHVGVDIRLVDSATGQIVKSYKADAKASDTGVGFVGLVKGINFGSDAFYKTPLGQATRDAIAQAVGFIVREMEVVEWSGRIVQTKEQEVYVNAGANVNLKPGTTLSVYSKGEELRDPSTGLVLGSRDRLIGTVTLTQIEERFSVGTYSGGEGLKRGDIVRLK